MSFKDAQDARIHGQSTREVLRMRTKYCSPHNKSKNREGRTVAMNQFELNQRQLESGLQVHNCNSPEDTECFRCDMSGDDSLFTEEERLTYATERACDRGWAQAFAWPFEKEEEK